MEQQWSSHMSPPAEDHYKNWIKKNNYVKPLKSIPKQKLEDNLNLKNKNTTVRKKNWEFVAS